jgi:hypothetical protein
MVHAECSVVIVVKNHAVEWLPPPPQTMVHVECSVVIVVKNHAVEWLPPPPNHGARGMLSGNSG